MDSGTSLRRHVTLLIRTMTLLALLVEQRAFGAIPGSERTALLSIYSQTSGRYWANQMNWGRDPGSECGWYGIGCNADQSHVVSIDLSSNGLNGFLVPPLDSFPELATFEINNNQVVGYLPALTGMTNLTSFSVAANKFYGKIPSLAGLSNLQKFHVEANEFAGNVPALDGLSQLSEFGASYNKLTGPLPDFSGVNLIYVDLSWNQLTGPIPALSNMTSLFVFNVGHNLLSGPIPSLTGLSQLSYLVLGYNQLTGAAPTPPSPNSLVPSSADVSNSLCPNLLAPVNDPPSETDLIWNYATASSPWSANCSLDTFVPVLPARLLDTRQNGPTVDGQLSGIGGVTAGAILNLDSLGRGGVPTAGVKAVVLNVTVTNPTAAGYITVWPSGAALPSTSNLNFVPGKTVPNLVIVAVGAANQVSFYNSAGTTDLVVDVVGYFTVASQLQTSVPQRYLDTRLGFESYDGAVGQGPVGGGKTINVDIADVAPSPESEAGALIMNVTATNATAPGFLTVWPMGDPRPLSSNLNFVPGQTVANLVVSKIDIAGQVSLFNSAAPTDYIVDVLGWYPAHAELNSLVPARLLDTRIGGITVDGQFAAGGALAASTSLDLSVTGRGGVPASARAILLNITVTNPTAPAFITAWPSGELRPITSNLNVDPGQTAANLVIAKIGVDGKISLFNSAGTIDIVADVVGYF